MRLVHITFALLLACCTAGSQAAAVNAKPGLWESTATAKMEGGVSPRVPDMSKLPKDQRARVEQSMAAREAPRPTIFVAQQCVSTEMLQKWETFAKGEDDCLRKVIDQSERHVKMSVSCASGRSVGEMEMTVVSNDRVTGKMALVMRSEAGAQKLNATLESRWLGADCGKLKPGERRPISSR
jgi:hypothetical protein